MRIMTLVHLSSNRAMTGGIIGGKTWSYILVCYGLPLFDVGLTMYLYGDDYGRDPRCFIGWENDTKHVFFFLQMATIAVRTIEISL